MTDVSQLPEIAMRLVAASTIGGLIGLNRDMRGKPAGLRMLGLVALGSALATVSVAGPGNDPAVTTDAMSRIIQGVLVGVGFLGAGVIMRDQTGNVHRLNTASSVWVTAVIGVVCGQGQWIIASIGALIVLILLTLGARVDKYFFGKFADQDSEKPGNGPD